MTEFCENCGEELDSDEEFDGICKKCKKSRNQEDEYVEDKDYIDPGIT
jgi:predicted amidophosphoribosyltransferase